MAIANQDDARARVLANQAEQLSRDIQYADARLRQGGLDIQAGQLALDRERAADQSQQWRSELSSRESLAGQDAGLRRELASMDIAAGARRDAASEAAAANDFYRNRTEANRIDRNNWNRFGGISGLGMGSNIRQSPRNFGGVSAPRRLGGFGFVVREPAGGAGGFGDEPWLRDPSPRNFGGVSAPRRSGGFGFVVREPAGGAGGFGDEPWLRDPRFVAKR